MSKKGRFRVPLPPLQMKLRHAEIFARFEAACIAAYEESLDWRPIIKEEKS